MPKKTTPTPKLDAYTKKRGMPLSFLTDDTEQELTQADLTQMKQIASYPVFQKRVDAHIRRAFANMSKDTFDVQRAVMEALGAFAMEFSESSEALDEIQRRQRIQDEMAVPNPFPDFGEQDAARGEIPEDTN